MTEVPPAAATVSDTLRSLTAALRRDFAAASGSIDREIAEILERWPTQPQPVRLANLRALQENVGRLMRSAAETARAALPEIVSEAYQLGGTTTALAAQRAATFAAIDRASVVALARDAYSDLLEATEHMSDTTKDVVRRLARDHARDRILTGRTAQQAARRLAGDLQGAGISAIVYRDGSNHSLADYSDMVVRTKTAEAFQRGGLAQGAALGIDWFEWLDNPSCGVDGHNDPTKANGQIVRRETAERFLLSHPRCVRVATARPDVTNEREARSSGARSSATEARRVADQQLVELAREEASARRAGRGLSSGLQVRASPATRLEERAGRSALGDLRPRAGAATSPAARARVVKVSQLREPGSVAARARAAKVAARRPDPDPVTVSKVSDPTPSTPSWSRQRTPKWIVDDLSRQALTKLDGDDISILQDYVQNGHFAPINAALRGVDLARAARGFEDFIDVTEPTDPGWLAQEVAELDRAIANSVTPGPLTLYRGVDDDVLTALKRGSVIEDAGYMSTSLNPDIAGGFGSTVMRITYPWNRPALHVDAVEDLNLNQNEVILPRDVRLVVRSVRKVDGKTVINVEAE